MSEFIEHYVKHCRNCNEYFGSDSLREGECIECYTPFNRAQRQYAVQNPELYELELNLADGELSTVIEQAEYLGLQGKILKVFGLFAVTENGIECLNHDYFIENARLHESNWVSHMAEKSWVVIQDFESALNYAKAEYKNS